MFDKRIAEIYIDELRERYDETTVPMFPPDTAVGVGDYGSFREGQWVKKGNLRDRGVNLPEPTENAIAPFDFASSGKVEVEPEVSIPKPGGGELVSAKIKFTRDRAVALSFQGGVERAHPDAPLFGRHLLSLWYGKELATDLAVVWKVRRANGGTLIVSEDGGATLEVRADPASLGAAGLSLTGMSVGVAFGAETKSSWKLSTPDVSLTTSMWLFKLDPKKRQAVDGFRFDAEPDELAAAIAVDTALRVTTDEILAQLGPADD